MNDLGKQLNEELSFVNWSQRNRQTVLQEIGKGDNERMNQKKWSVGFLLAAALMLLTVGAIAAGILFTSHYDAGKLADAAMLEVYGIEPKIMTLLHRQIVENSDGSATVTYEALEPDVREGVNPIGVYTVTVRDGKASASWSLDGVSTDGGLEASAWGTEQLRLYVDDYANTRRFMKENYLLAEEYPVAAIPYEEWIVQEEQRKAEVLAASTITLEQARNIAKAALIQEYHLTEEQQARLIIWLDEDDQTSYAMVNGQPMVSLFYHLTQGDEWMEMDGIYVVTVNMKTGAVDEIFYDSGLAGNG